jgi:hypothetical protein
MSRRQYAMKRKLSSSDGRPRLIDGAPRLADFRAESEGALRSLCVGVMASIYRIAADILRETSIERRAAALLDEIGT